MKIVNEIIDVMPSPNNLPTGTIYGYYSAFLPQKIRLIPKKHYIERDGHEGTQTTLTRHWIKENKKKRKCRPTELAGYSWATAPLYCKPRTMERGVYIDIKSAYGSIYEILGWEVDYLRGMYLAPSPDMMNYPYSDLKVARSYVVTGSRAKGNVTTVRNGFLKSTSKYNPYSNPSLVASVLDVLSMIARFAVYACDASYFNTDGAIMGEGQSLVFGQFLQSIGLDYSIKYSGSVYIANVNNWEIGEKKVRRGSDGGLLRGDWINLGKAEAEDLYTRYLQAYQGRQ